jgi:2-C-methyl-D-erythritol 4-phosphate cytidylyltransferase
VCVYKNLFQRKPLFLYALEAFISIKYVKKIAVVVDDVENAKSSVQEKSLLGLQKVVFVRGERTRHRSIKAGLQELYKHHKGC